MEMLDSLTLKKIVLMTMIINFSVEEINETTIDVCSPDNEIFYQDDSEEIEAYYWILKNDTCSGNNGILVLKFMETTVVDQDGDCLASLEMLGFEICYMAPLNCIAYSPNEYINTSAVSILGCRNTQWMFKDNLFPVEIQYNSKYVGSYHFRIHVFYVSYQIQAMEKGKLSTTQMTTTIENKSNSTSFSVTKNTTYTASSLNPSFGLEQTNTAGLSTSQIIVIILGILLGVVFFLSMLLLYRNKRLRRQITEAPDNHLPTIESIGPTEQTTAGQDLGYRYPNEQADSEIRVTTQEVKPGSGVKTTYRVVEKAANGANMKPKKSNLENQI